MDAIFTTTTEKTNPLAPRAFELDHQAIQAHHYALLNPLQIEAETYVDLPVNPIVPEPFKLQPQYFPLLVPLDRLDFRTRVDLLDRSECWAQDHDIPWLSALLTCERSASCLALHLAKAMTIRRLDGRHNAARVHDPRIFRHLGWLLDSEQLNRLLGPVTRWSWQEPDGQWLSISPSESRPFRVQWTAQAQASLARIPEVNGSLRLLRSALPDWPGDAALAPRIDALLAKAQETHALADKADRRLFVEQALCHGAGIHTHPALQQRLRQLRRQETSYVGACADLAPDDLPRFAAELPPSANAHKEWL